MICASCGAHGAVVRDPHRHAYICSNCRRAEHNRRVKARGEERAVAPVDKGAEDEQLTFRAEQMKQIQGERP